MKAKAAARFHGRRGGRFAEDGAGSLLAELHAVRLAELRKGPELGVWPLRSLREWDRVARAGAARGEGFSLSPRELLAVEVVETARAAGWRW